MSAEVRRMRIGDFLLRRLSEIGTTHVFGVPGDYNMSFLDQLQEHPEIKWVGTCNELNAAYAADGHARSGKPGVLLTTYGVGCLSAINGIAGAYCEHVPLIHVSGSPPAHAVHDRVPLHHSLLDGGYRNIHRAFTEFTEYAATISPANAVEVIDHARIDGLEHLVLGQMVPDVLFVLGDHFVHVIDGRIALHGQTSFRRAGGPRWPPSAPWPIIGDRAPNH